jgi:hypothetical protein
MGEKIKIDPSRFGGPSAQKRSQEEAQTQGTQTSTARGQADLSYIAPKAKADLTDAQLKIIRDVNANARDELKTFEGLEIVKTYDQGMRYFTTALNVPIGRAGDQDLVTLAAKVQDPTGAVMQGDIERYNNLQTALQYIPQQFRDQFQNEGKFSPEARRDIIAFMRNRIDTYRLPYEETRKGFEGRIGQFNEQLGPLGVKPIEVDKILPGDPLKLYQPKIDAYDKKLEADRIRKDREAGGPRVGLLEGVPEGMQIAGEDIKGWRLSPESEAEVVTYVRQPGATPEGYAQLLADKSIAEGHLLPSQRADYMQRTIADNQDFFKQSPEQRVGTQTIDYSQIDKAASENAGLFDSVAQAARNLPESGAQLVEGLTALPKDALLSALTGTRTGTIKTFTDLAMELGQGRLDGPTTKAFADAMKERYGSLDAIQRTGVKDPLGLLGDLSMILSGGGTAAARLPGVAGSFGKKVATAGRVIDPLSGGVAAVTEGLPALYQAGKDRIPGAVQGVENLPSNVVGFPSNTGGAAIREAAGSGFERGVTGAPTARSESFTEGMRRPGESAESIVYTARDAIRGLRQAASNAYSTAMQQFGQNPVPLSIDVVRQRMSGIKPRNYDAMLNAPKRPPDHVAWDQMNDTVEYYAQQAAADPSLLEPMAMDQFKQDLYEIGAKIGGQYDKSAANIAKTAYNAVRQELVKHDPVYADIMRDYERAAVEARELEDTFSLGQARGKPLKVDAAARKLQSILRNNAFTNYGMRARQGERLAELDPTGTLMSATSGQMLSAPFARGITGGVAAGGLPLTAAGALVNPMTLLATIPTLLASSPRLAGELTYGAGRVAGTGKRAFDAAAQSPFGEGLGTLGKSIADLYQKYPQAFLAEAQLGTRLQETEEEKRRRLRERYGITVPELPPEMSAYLKD